MAFLVVSVGWFLEEIREKVRTRKVLHFLNLIHYLRASDVRLNIVIQGNGSVKGNFELRTTQRAVLGVH